MSVKRHEFKPDWCIAPSETLREWLEENGLSVRVATRVARNVTSHDEAIRLVTDVLERKPLTERHARVLACVTAITPRFWLALEHNYRAGLAAGLTDASD